MSTSPINAAVLNRIEVDHARFNALKTVSTGEPSQFQHERIGDLDVTRDAARRGSYYNRILGLTPASAEQLDAAMSWIRDATSATQTVRVDTNPSNLPPGLTGLADAGFRHTDTLVWMSADPAPADASAAKPSSPTVQLLAPGDRPAVRSLLEEQGGPIADAIWDDKRQYLCTDTFRWFGVFEGDLLISAASTWTAGDVAIFGSAYTRPAWRNQGHQRELLDERLRLTSERPIVDVEPQSTSYRNCVAAGFSDLEYRHVWEQVAAS